MMTGDPNPDCTSTEADMLDLGLAPLGTETLGAGLLAKPFMAISAICSNM